MGETERYSQSLVLYEGWLCLDFANTAWEHASDAPVERLEDYAQLVNWAQSKGIVTHQEAEALLTEAALRPMEAKAIFQRSILIREVIFRIYTAIVHKRDPQPADLSLLNAALAEANTHFHIVPFQGDFIWDWHTDEQQLDSFLWPIVRSAANLLTSSDLERVGQCADDHGCGWLFLDVSRNRSRRWCSMEHCGNRAKARHHYKRQRSEPAA